MRLIVIALVFLVVSCNYGAGVGEKIYTPSQYINHVPVTKHRYSQDSVYVIRQLTGLLQMHKESFYAKEYDSLSELSIDTLIYSDNLNKLAAFILCKTKSSSKSQDNNYQYDAYCYLGIRDPQPDTISLKWLGRFNPTNWKNKYEVSSLIRDMYFTEFAAIKDTSGAYWYKYNLNDKRFWNSVVWQEYFHQ
jgi:hypothetical protein